MKITKIIRPIPTIEGAGVRLKRVFSDDHEYDPFLLFDDFSSRRHEDYLAGFPWHPHRGIETVTYLVKGKVRHKDSIGNSGIISDGQVQWMTAGSGIIHEEMPMVSDELLGFQLWVNLPKKNKMMPPRYNDIKELPTVKSGKNEIRIISGEYDGVKGLLTELMVNIRYMDITVDGAFEMDLEKGHKNIIYVFDGLIEIDDKMIKQYGCLIEGDRLKVDGKGRFLFISGKPLDEPVAWGGPIVMNTQEELKKAFEEFRNGTFIK